MPDILCIISPRCTKGADIEQDDCMCACLRADQFGHHRRPDIQLVREAVWVTKHQEQSEDDTWGLVIAMDTDYRTSLGCDTK